MRAAADADVTFDRELGKERHQGRVALHVAPRPRGAGNSVTVGDFLPAKAEDARKNFAPALLDAAALEGVRDALQSGELTGCPVTDVAVTVTGVTRQEGLTTAPGCPMAAAQALREALAAASPVALEPLMRVEITTPEDFLGAAINLFTSCGGKVEELEDHGGRKLLRGTAPLRRLFGFPLPCVPPPRAGPGWCSAFARFDCPEAPMRQPHPAAAPRAKKSLGQHFLKNPDICDRIAALLEATAQDNILEIGPGPGALTRSLEALPHARLLLLEKDRYWAGERQRAAQPGTQAVLTDALRFAWARITPAFPWKLAGNLPYNVASPLIWDCLSQATGCTRAVFMVQKEVGLRLAAAPGNGQYGALSVWVQSYAAPRLEFTLGPGAFNPPPKVDSAVLSFTPLSLASRPEHPQLLARLLRICFQQRRKQLGGIIRRSGEQPLAQALHEAEIDPGLRPEALGVGQWQRLSALWAAQLDKQA